MTDQFNSDNYSDDEPSELVAGNRWAWKRTDLGVDYPPATYSFSYELSLDSGVTKIAITAGESGSDYIIEVPSATTAGYTAGTYKFHAFITRTADNERVLVDKGTIVVKPDYATSTADQRSHVKKTLDALEATIEAKATKDQLSHTIDGRSISRMNPEEVINWMNKYKAWYAQELKAERLGNSVKTSKIYTRF